MRKLSQREWSSSNRHQYQFVSIHSDVITSRDTSATGRGGRGGGRGTDRKSERGRGAGGKPSTLVQTSGLFSEGTGEAKLRKSSSVFDRNAGAGDSASQMRRPTLIKRESKVDQDAERKSIQDVLGTMMDDDEDDQLGGAASSAATGLNGADAPAGGAATGSADTDLFSPIALQETRTTQQQRTLRYPDTLDELFASVEQQLFVMQLPDTLPGHGPDLEPAESAEAECHAADEAKLNPLASFCTAQQLDDGLVGRVVRRRSGKIQMLLGDVVYNLSVGIDPGWLQEVMSVQTTDADRRHGSLNNLGQIGAKLNVTPDWERLFAARAAEAKLVAKHVGSNGSGAGAEYLMG